MIGKFRRFIQRKLDQSSLEKWDDEIELAKDLDPDKLRRLRGRARQLQKRVNQVIHIADGRLAMPRDGADTIRKPQRADWAFRPEIWSGPISPHGALATGNQTKFGGASTLFHDCPLSELTLRQVRNNRQNDLAPFGLRLDVFGFTGSFLSLALDLPQDGLKGLRRNHILRLDTDIEAEKPIVIFARLNIKCGPNTEQIVRELHIVNAPTAIEFDLANAGINETRLDRAWLELIFDRPSMTGIFLRDVTLTRRPRAEF